MAVVCTQHAQVASHQPSMLRLTLAAALLSAVAAAGSATQPATDVITRNFGAAAVSTRPNISESHSEISTLVPHCITGAVAGR